MTPEILTAIVSIVAIVIAIYAIYKASQAGTAISPEYITATLQASTSTATELTEVALTAAQAAEQLYRTGKIERGERLDTAFKYVEKFFPNLDQKTILTAIEAGVLVVNTLVEAIPAKRDGGP